MIRGGYSRIYGRLNGVNLVLVPLLGTGLEQAVSCIGAVRSPNGNQCLGPAGADPRPPSASGPMATSRRFPRFPDPAATVLSGWH